MTLQGFVWDCGVEEQPRALAYAQGHSLQAVAQALLLQTPLGGGLHRSAMPHVGLLCVSPDVVLAGMPILKMGRVVFLGLPGAAVGDEPSSLLALTPASLPQAQCDQAYRAFMERLGVGKRASSIPRASKVDAEFGMRIELFAPSQPAAAESDDESYECTSDSDSDAQGNENTSDTA